MIPYCNWRFDVPPKTVQPVVLVEKRVLKANQRAVALPRRHQRRRPRLGLRQPVKTLSENALEYEIEHHHRTDTPMIQRKAIRAVIMTPDHRVLLMKVQEPVTGFQVWLTPGGGLEPGESDEEGLRREIAEETGARDFRLGQPIWTRKCEFSWNGRIHSQHEVYYLVQADYFVPVMDVEAAPGEASAFREFHWWTIDAIARSEETFAPRNLHCLLESISKNGPPDEPFSVGA